MRRARRPFAAIALLVGVVTAACDGRPKHATSTDDHAPRTGPAIATIDLSGGAPEQEGRGILGVPLRHGSFDRLVRTIADVAKDDDVHGVLVRFGDGALGIARAEETGELLERLRTHGKPVYCHANGYSNTTMLTAARGCTKIYVAPAGEVEAVGIAAQVIYLRKLLADELHLTIDILQVGKFKGAEEPLTRDGPSDEARASLEGVLADLRTVWLDGIRKGRGRDDVAAAAEDGPYSPSKAKERGLVDEVGFADDAANALKKEAGAVREDARFGPGADDKPEDLGDIVRLLASPGSSSAPIALVRASGAITMSGEASVMGGRGGISEKELGKLLVRVEKDDDVKAVVLRIDSPGGSALASDLLWHALMKIRAKKPLVVSVGDMAASGGYFLSCAGTVIFAEPTSIVGSIGVVGGKVAFGGALEKIGVHSETFPAKRGDPAAANRAAYLSPLLGWDDATKVRVLETMTGIYDLFLARISEGRHTTPDKIAPFAEGRIFTGRQGKEHGLVDELGGLSDAIARARELAHLPNDARVAPMSSHSGILEALESGGAAETAVAAMDPTRAIDPFVVLERLAPELVPFAVSFAALAQGEHTAAALPFALRVE